ncbi:MAG: maleylpyruvate isomerase family mycothiol-dependent enzyme [Acidimicrobiaceae bacterium]|nr:maleylpyruvate isomerase family mycothiol-dependent enzyme [Acidimicrobiaceae bacterium]
MAEFWANVRPEREALAADLHGIDSVAWATLSLCPGWTVRDVLAHMTALARMTPARFFQKLLVNGFNPSRVEARDITVEKGSTVEETLARFRSITARKNGLPGQSKTLLGETVVHAEDIRRPLGIAHEYRVEALVTVADHYARSNLIAGSKRRIAGLSLQANDIGWSTGSGPVVSGPMLSLLMVMAGRHAPIEDLQGKGLAILRSRI